MVTAEHELTGDLTAIYGQLTLLQRRIVRQLVDDPAGVAFATIDELAGSLGISLSTIVRFTQRLGLAGYPALQLRARAIIRSRLQPAQRSCTLDPPVSEVAGSELFTSIAHDSENLRQTVASVGIGDVERAGALLAAARSIVVVGELASEPLARFAELALTQIRAATSFLASPDTIPLADLVTDDVLLVFSFPPYARRTLQLCRYAKQEGASCVVVVDTPLAPVANYGDVIMTAKVAGLGPQNSLVAPLAVTNALVHAVTTLTPSARHRQGAMVELIELAEGGDGLAVSECERGRALLLPQPRHGAS